MSDKTDEHVGRAVREAPYTKTEPEKVKKRKRRAKANDWYEKDIPPPPDKLGKALEAYVLERWHQGFGPRWISCGLDAKGEPITQFSNFDREFCGDDSFKERCVAQAKFFFFEWHHPDGVPDPSRNNFACVECGCTKDWQKVVRLYNSLSEDVKPYFSVTSRWNIDSQKGQSLWSNTCSVTITHYCDKLWPNYSSSYVDVKSRFTSD